MLVTLLNDSLSVTSQTPAMSCVLASVEHVPRDLELKEVVRHCRNLVGLVAADCHRVHDV